MLLKTKLKRYSLVFGCLFRLLEPFCNYLSVNKLALIFSRAVHHFFCKLKTTNPAPYWPRLRLTTLWLLSTIKHFRVFRVLRLKREGYWLMVGTHVNTKTKKINLQGKLRQRTKNRYYHYRLTVSNGGL